jgi:hypothetical protein
MALSVTKKQLQFIEAGCDEVLFGGAAGGGKSFGQLIDAFYYGMKYPKSKQLILRRTLPELDKNPGAGRHGPLTPKKLSYGAAAHTGRFANGLSSTSATATAWATCTATSRPSMT